MYYIILIQIIFSLHFSTNVLKKFQYYICQEVRDVFWKLECVSGKVVNKFRLMTCISIVIEEDIIAMEAKHGDPTLVSYYP